MCQPAGAEIPATEAAVKAAKLDLLAQRNEFAFMPPIWLCRVFLPALHQQRDAPLLFLLLNVALVTLPSALALYLLPPSHFLGLAYFAINYCLFLQRFMLTLHFTEHRTLFRKGHSLLNSVCSNCLSPFFGVPAGMYNLHHCIMHHVEDNHFPHDATSTEPYQRDSLLHFLWYYVRHWTIVWVQLPCYALKKQRYGLVLRSLALEVLNFAVVWYLWRAAPLQTLWVFVLPFFTSSLALMFGNWSQHIFVDPCCPENSYRMTYNCINCPDNQRTFNDGYHILHHLNSKLHWTELPQRFIETLHQHDDEDALVFEGIGFFDVGLAACTGQLGFLADHIVPCGARQAGRSRDEKIALLQNRLKPVPSRRCRIIK